MLLRVRMRYFMERRLSAVAALEILHEGDERLHAGERHGVVDAGAHAADRAVTFEAHEPRRPRLGEEGRIELRPREREGDVHPRAAGLRHRVCVEAGLVDRPIEELGLRPVARRHRLETALSLYPFEHQPADVPAEGGRCIEHRALGTHGLVIPNGGSTGGGFAEKTLTYDNSQKTDGPMFF